MIVTPLTAMPAATMIGTADYFDTSARSVGAIFLAISFMQPPINLRRDTYRARPRNAIIARSTSMTCSTVSRPTRTWTFDLLTVVSLSIITSLS